MLGRNSSGLVVKAHDFHRADNLGYIPAVSRVSRCGIRIGIRPHCCCRASSRKLSFYVSAHPSLSNEGQQTC